MASVDANISDLFFNYDSDDDIAIKDDDGNFMSYDVTKLTERAKTFLGYLERLGVAVPPAEALIADFLARV
jgi:hypothetical protein